MTPALASLLMPLMRGMDPERAHDLALRALRFGLAGADHSPDDPILATRVLGRDFRNPIGLSAGFDKSAVAIGPLMRLGFGFVEAGSVTPRPQIGNPRPRLFRLVEDRAVINRMGMNNGGIDAFRARIAALRDRPAVLGVNIAINKEGADPLRDYPALYAEVAALADYVAVNISSPNTPGLRQLHETAALRELLDALRAANQWQRPVFLKISPDESLDQLEQVIATALTAGISGIIATNTTISRPNLHSANANEVGGLSGVPLRDPAMTTLRHVARLTDGNLPIISVGGISSAQDVYARLRAGASLVQLYTALVYQGPAIVAQLSWGLAALLRRDGVSDVRQIIGVDRNLPA
jgi:dihydroorotate dehydrogenase